MPSYHRPGSVYGAYHFLQFSGDSAVITGLEDITPFVSLVFRCLIEELGVQLGRSETRVLCRFHGLIVVAAELSFSSKEG